MKKPIILLFLMSLIINVSVIYAQDDDLKRPKNIGVSDFDNFKNNSFDVYDESASLKENVTHIDNEIKQYSGIMNEMSLEKVKANLKALKESKQAVQKLEKDIKELDDTGEAMLKNAKNVTPKTKSMGATKNTKSSLAGLDRSKSNLKAVNELLENDIKILTEELKSRGEPIE